jgi:hypothetical protein
MKPLTDTERVALAAEVAASGEPIRLVVESAGKGEMALAGSYERQPSPGRRLMADCHRRCAAIWREVWAELEAGRKGAR